LRKFVNRLRSILLRVVSGGGWMANTVNQMPDGFMGDRNVRPFMVSGSILFCGFVSLMFCSVLPGEVRRGEAPRELLAIAITIGFALAGVLIAAGLFAGYVPFLSLPNIEPGANGAISRNARERLPAYVTGVVEEGGDKRRYRSRAAVLTHTGSGNVRIEVRPWTWWLAQRVPGLVRHGGSPLLHRYVASTTLEPADVTSIVRGTAYLVGSEKPAIRLLWKHGPVILAFDELPERDEVFASLQRGQTLMQ
jgi:hypothetical protein